MRAVSLTMIAAIAAVPMGAVADEGARIGIRATVPTICRVDLAQSILTRGVEEYDLGEVKELCNNIGGYQIVLSHPQGLTDAEAIVDGVVVPLSASGRTVLVESNVPAERRRQIRLTLGQDASLVTHIGLQAIPKGFVY